MFRLASLGGLRIQHSRTPDRRSPFKEVIWGHVIISGFSSSCSSGCPKSRCPFCYVGLDKKNESKLGSIVQVPIDGISSTSQD